MCLIIYFKYLFLRYSCETNYYIYYEKIIFADSKKLTLCKIETS